MGHIKAMFQNPGLYFAGLYFTVFKKEFKKNNITIHVPFHLTDIAFRGRFMKNKYEKEEATHLANYLTDEDSVLELGSCLGYVSCITNKILGDKRKHIVLEANPHLISWIEKNKQENNCHFKIEHCIISNKKNNEFFIHDLIVGGSTRRKTGNSVVVSGTTFQALKEKHGINFNTLIMDIEGGELDLFREHAHELIHFQKIFYEVHPFANILSKEEAQECENILSNLGFELVLRDGEFQIWHKA